MQIGCQVALAEEKNEFSFPTQSGLRLFIDGLLQVSELTAAEREIIAPDTQSDLGAEQLLRQAVESLSHRPNHRFGASWPFILVPANLVTPVVRNSGLKSVLVVEQDEVPCIAKPL